MSSVPEYLNEDQLLRYLTATIEKAFEKIHENNPQIKLDYDEKKDLAQTIASTILNDKNRTEIAKDALEMNPSFLHKLTMALVMTSTLNNSDKNINLFKKLDEFFTSKDIKNENDLEKKLTPEELKELKLLQEELRELNKEMLAELKSTNLIRPTPDAAGKKREEELEQTFDSNTNLLGLINTKESGGFPAIIQVLLGNFLGTPNQNPNYESSYSQISLQNKTSDTAGDPLSLNIMAKENLETLGVDFVDKVEMQYRHNEATQMKLTPPK